LEVPENQSFTIRDCHWLHLGSAGGVVFLDRKNVNFKIDRRVHAWSEINRQGASPTDLRSRTYRTVWLDHGSNIEPSEYAYVLLPNLPEEPTRLWASAPAAKLIESSPVSHAVSVVTEARNVTAYVFWKAGKTLDHVEASAALIVTVIRKARLITLAFQDPMQADTGTITVSMPLTSSRLVRLDQGITANCSADTMVLQLERKGLNGRTLTAELAVQA
jgi:hyaluronate lyase